ncbi:hypothetical protein SAMN05518672_108180 [Chitinophaga sp. CF118]|nr:hypothetical protein SAMN05518672_108180 [Chitinophaga sp. CF118]
MDPVYMEAFVIADIEKKILGYWSWHMEMETSVMRYYQSALKGKWPGWQVVHLANNMYDAEPLMGIDYVALQQSPKPDVLDANLITGDPVNDEWPNGLFVIKEHGKIYVVESHNVTVEDVIRYGEAAISQLKARPAIPLPIEGETRTLDHLLIDVDNKILILDTSEFGLYKHADRQWPNYIFKMGKIGYLAMLEAGDISTVGLEMPQQKIIDSFNHISNARKDDAAEILNVEAKVAHSVFYDVTPTDTFLPKKAEPKPVAIQERLSDAAPTTIGKPKRPADKTSFAQKIIQWWKRLTN